MDAEKIKSIISPIIKSHGVEIANISYAPMRAGAFLRVYVDRKITEPVPVPYPGSAVDLKLLERISKEISAAVEAHQSGHGRLVLEVSSPGLDRPIADNGEYRFFLGHPMKIRMKLPLGERRNFSGRLVSVEEIEGRAESITIETLEGPFILGVSGIEKARLDPGFRSPQAGVKKKGRKKCHGK